MHLYGKENHRGFNLTELLITIAIIGILSSIAFRVYTPYVRKGRRIDGVNALLAISLSQERWRATHTTYGTLAQVYGGGATSSEGWYTLSVTNISPTGYTATATAVGRQVGDAVDSTSCNTLTLTNNNGTLTRTPAACWPT